MVALVGAVAVVAMGCGTRAGPSGSAAALSQPPRSAATEAPASSAAEVSPVQTSPSAEPTPVNESHPAPTPSNTGQVTVRATGKPTKPGSPAPVSASGGEQVSGRESDPAGAASAPSIPGAIGDTPGEPQQRSPVILASVGTYSGPAGANIVVALQAAQLWVKHINQKGGVNGHKVTLLVYDDGGDTARHKAQVQEAVERRHAIAFLMNGEPLTGAASVEYITKKRVPVVGDTGPEEWVYSSPMYFPQQTAGDISIYAHLASTAQQALPLGKTKLGSVVCVEVEACTAGDRLVAEHSSELGFDLVYRAKGSIGQPDFTAQCIAARNAGVQVLFPLFDMQTVTRLAASCARQGYKPTFTIFSGIIAADHARDPNLAGAVGSVFTFPWFQTGTPATEEFQEAMRRYGNGIPAGATASMGWTAGKLMEKAAANMPEPPTSEAVLRGLWSLKSETLGGLTSPLTFLENQPPARLPCWFNLATGNGSWVSPDGFQRHCRPSPGNGGR